MGAHGQSRVAPIGSPPLKKVFLAMAAAAAAIAVLVGVTLPPKRRTLTAFADGSIPGIVHVHTNRSDGSQTPEAVAAAAARAGLRFVIFTDHGDGTRKPDPPEYRSGVLCIDGVELSTAGGHYLAMDIGASPYPLAGEARDVVEDVRRLGGFGIVAHPDSPKPELRWTDWQVPFDGIEVLNLDTGWRRPVAEMRDREHPAGRRLRGAGKLAEALLDYPFRPAETIARLAGAAGDVEGEIAAEKTRRRVVTIAGADAHANLELKGDPGDSRPSVRMPGYEPTFRTLSVHVHTERPVSGDAAADARMVLRAIRNGHLHTVMDGFATPASFEFTAANSLGTVHEGDELSVGGPVVLQVRNNAPPGFTTTIHNSGGGIAVGRTENDLTVQAPADPDVYWVEISTGGAHPVVWLRSNAIYIRGDAPLEAASAHQPATASEPLLEDATTGGWHVERDETSQAAFDVIHPDGALELRFRWGLSGGTNIHQYVGLAVDTPNGVVASDRIVFTARAERPMRISVQLRDGGEGRWQRSVFVPAFSQERTVFFDDLNAPLGAAAGRSPDLTRIRNILFVVDTTNTKPGASGRLWIKNVALQH